MPAAVFYGADAAAEFFRRYDDAFSCRLIDVAYGLIRYAQRHEAVLFCQRHRVMLQRDAICLMVFYEP